jgi:tRNA pseudouridine13 synthase
VLANAGQIRSQPQDFAVDEELGFTFTNAGEHVMLRIRKTARNTDDVARQLARFAKVPRKSVSYAGLKDKNAVTSQFFSVHLPGQQDPDWQQLADSSIEVLAVTRHQKKLKRGALSCNHFRLLIREFSGDREMTEQRLQLIQHQGVPNYFAGQRFGHANSNLVMAEEMLIQGRRVKDRFRRNLFYAAARSWLFNLVLAERIHCENWNRALVGDSMMLKGSRSTFHLESIDEEILSRVDGMDISPTGPLWGNGLSRVSAEALKLENNALKDWQDWMEGLEKAGMQLARRALRVTVQDLCWEWPENNQLQLSFSLAPGSYATAILRELGEFSEPLTSTHSLHQ